MADYNTLFGEIGGAVQDLFAAEGAGREQSSYQRAAALANQNAQLEAQSTRIRETQLQRDIYKSVSGTRAQISGAGFLAGGSGGDVLRESIQQGELSKGILAEQGLIKVNAFQEQSEALGSLARAAGQARSGNIAAGAAQAASGGFSLLENLGGSIFGGSSSGGSADIASAASDSSNVLDVASSADIAGAGAAGDSGSFLSDFGDFFGGLF